MTFKVLGDSDISRNDRLRAMGLDPLRDRAKFGLGWKRREYNYYCLHCYLEITKPYLCKRERRLNKTVFSPKNPAIHMNQPASRKPRCPECKELVHLTRDDRIQQMQDRMDAIFAEHRKVAEYKKRWRKYRKKHNATPTLVSKYLVKHYKEYEMFEPSLELRPYIEEENFLPRESKDASIVECMKLAYQLFNTYEVCKRQLDIARKIAHKGQQAMKVDDAENAIEYYTNAMAARIDYLPFYVARGECYFAIRRYVHCIHDCTLAIDMALEIYKCERADDQKNVALALILRARAFKEELRLPEAKRDLEQALELRKERYRNLEITDLLAEVNRLLTFNTDPELDSDDSGDDNGHGAENNNDDNMDDDRKDIELKINETPIKMPAQTTTKKTKIALTDAEPTAAVVDDDDDTKEEKSNANADEITGGGTTPAITTLNDAHNDESASMNDGQILFTFLMSLRRYISDPALVNDHQIENIKQILFSNVLAFVSASADNCMQFDSKSIELCLKYFRLCFKNYTRTKSPDVLNNKSLLSLILIVNHLCGHNAESILTDQSLEKLLVIIIMYVFSFFHAIKNMAILEELVKFVYIATGIPSVSDAFFKKFDTKFLRIVIKLNKKKKMNTHCDEYVLKSIENFVQSQPTQQQQAQQPEVSSNVNVQNFLGKCVKLNLFYTLLTILDKYLIINMEIENENENENENDARVSAIGVQERIIVNSCLRLLVVIFDFDNKVIDVLFEDKQFITALTGKTTVYLNEMRKCSDNTANSNLDEHTLAHVRSALDKIQASLVPK